MFDKGFFGGLFDLDGDGKLNAFERAADFALFNEIMQEEEKSESDEFEDDFDDDFSEDSDDFDF